MIVYWILTLPRFVAYTPFVCDSIGQGSKQCKMGNGSKVVKLPILLIFSIIFIYLGQVGASKNSNIYKEK